jgi:hypothetical protein
MFILSLNAQRMPHKKLVHGKAGIGSPRIGISAAGTPARPPMLQTIYPPVFLHLPPIGISPFVHYIRAPTGCPASFYVRGFIDFSRIPPLRRQSIRVHPLLYQFIAVHRIHHAVMGTMKGNNRNGQAPWPRRPPPPASAGLGRPCAWPSTLPSCWSRLGTPIPNAHRSRRKVQGKSPLECQPWRHPLITLRHRCAWDQSSTWSYSASIIRLFVSCTISFDVGDAGFAACSVGSACSHVGHRAA